MTQWTGATDKSLSLCLIIGLGISLLLALVSACVMSLGADEGYILLGVQGLAENGVYATGHGRGALATGGIYTLVETLLIMAAGNTLPVLRLFPLFCFVLLMLEIVRSARHAGYGPVAALLATTPLIAMPGTLTLAGSAYGAVPAVLLLVVALRLWDTEAKGWRRLILVGALLGLAAATRVQTVLILPAFFLGSVDFTRPWKTQLKTIGVPLVIGGLVFGSCYLGLIALQGPSVAGIERAASSAGSALSFDFAMIAKKWVMAEQRVFSLPVLVATTVLLAWLQRSLGGSRKLRSLTVFGWLVWLMWVSYAPRPHLRYLWVGLAPLSIVLGFGLSAWYQWGAAGVAAGARRAAIAVGFACLVAGGVTTARHIWVGNLNVVFWEWREISAMAPVVSKRDVHFGNHQAVMAQRLAELPADAVVAVDRPIELEFLSGRPLLSLKELTRKPRKRPEALPGWLVMTPHTRIRMHLPPDGWSWIKENCRVEALFGDFALYQVVGPYPKDLKILRPRRGPWREDRGLGQQR